MEYTLIKNALVLTLDSQSNAGRFTIVIKGDKIAAIENGSDAEISAKYPNAKVIDAAGRLITPAFFNSHTDSGYYFSGIYQKGSSYENISSNIPLGLINKYFSNPDNSKDLEDLFTVRYYNALISGEFLLVESSSLINVDFCNNFLVSTNQITQGLCIVAYDAQFCSKLAKANILHCMGLAFDDEINNYSLSALEKSGRTKIFFQALRTRTGLDSAKQHFGKPLTTVLNEKGLLTQNVLFSNPVYFDTKDVELAGEKRASVVFCPSDLIRLSHQNIEFEDYYISGMNILTGTGLTGKSILQELRKFYELTYKYNIECEQILKTATINPAKFFGCSDTMGSIERGKYADFCFFDLTDVRNVPILPEITSESLSEFVLTQLTPKDVMDVMIRGRMYIRNKQSGFDSEEIAKKTKRLGNIVFEAGKYFEFKEKYLMRKRVSEILLNANSEDKNIKPSDLYTDGPELGDEGFRIIDRKRPEYIQRQESKRVIEEDNPENLEEINSLIEEINLFDAAEEPETIPIKEEPKNDNKIVKEKPELPKEVKTAEAKKEKITEVLSSKPAAKELPKISIKLEKLKFGFSDGDDIIEE